MKKVVSKLGKEKNELLYLTLCLTVYLALTSLLNITCLIKYITGVSCPGCGMTRALKSLIVFDFSKAFYYHPLVFFIIPIAVLLLVFTVNKMYKTRKIFITFTATLFMVVYAYRLFFTKTAIVVFEPYSSLVSKFLRWII